MIEFRMEGLDRVEHAINVLTEQLAPATLELHVLKIAAEAGEILKIASVRALIEAVYDHPNFPSLASVTPSDLFGTFGGNAEQRTDDLLHSIIHRDQGLTQIVEVDPDMPVSENAHSGREMVIDYAEYVHEGYTQWIPDGRGGSTNTGIFHPGRFWFDVAMEESDAVILAFIEVAYGRVIEHVMEML